MTVLQNKFSKNSEKILRLEKYSCCPGQGGRKMTVLQQIFENLPSLPARKFEILKIYRFYPASKIFLAVQNKGIEKTDQWRRQGSSELVGTEAPKLIFLCVIVQILSKNIRLRLRLHFYISISFTIP